MRELNSLIRLRSLHGRNREELQVLNRYDLINKDNSRSGIGTPIRGRVDTALDDIRSGKDLEMGMVGVVGVGRREGWIQGIQQSFEGKSDCS